MSSKLNVPDLHISVMNSLAGSRALGLLISTGDVIAGLRQGTYLELGD